MQATTNSAQRRRRDTMKQGEVEESMNKNKLMQGVGGYVAGQVARQHVGEGKAVDIKLGMALLRDSRVPVTAKLTSMGLGIALVALIDTLEFPMEALLAVLLPVLGMGINLAGDGIEYVAGSLLFAALLVPHLAPKDAVSRIRAERAGPIPVQNQAR